MRKIRIGKDISLVWKVTTDGKDVSLVGRDLTLELSNITFGRVPIDFSVEGNSISFTFRGVDHRDCLGVYSLTLWENKGQMEQNVLDYNEAFRLVSNTALEGDEGSSDNIEIETINLGTSDFRLAGGSSVPGRNGATFIPFVDSQGNISWTNDGNLPNPRTVNIKGPEGEPGRDGDTPYIGDNGNWWIGGKENPETVNIKGKDGENSVSLGDISLVNEFDSSIGSEKKVISQKALTLFKNDITGAITEIRVKYINNFEDTILFIPNIYRKAGLIVSYIITKGYKKELHKLQYKKDLVYCDDINWKKITNWKSSDLSSNYISNDLLNFPEKISISESLSTRIRIILTQKENDIYLVRLYRKSSAYNRCMIVLNDVTLSINDLNINSEIIKKNQEGKTLNETNNYINNI